MSIWFCSFMAVVFLYVYQAGYINARSSPTADVCAYDSLPRANRWPLGLDLILLTLKAVDELHVLEFFLDNFRRLGNTYRQVIGSSASILTIEPANIESLLSLNMKDWGVGFRRTIFLPMLGDGIFLQEGDAWKHSREILRPHFYHRYYEDLELFRSHVANMLEAISSSATNVVDLEPIFLRLTLDITSEFLLGESVWSQRPTLSVTSHDFEDAFDLAQSILSKRLRFPKLYWLVDGRKLREACNIIHQFTDRILIKTLTSDDASRLKTVAEHYQERDALRDQAINVLTAGRDSTATFLSWTFYHLVRHPAVMAKLRKEISSVDEAVAPLTRAGLLRYSYLQNVIKEVIRLHPPVPLISRTALRDTTLPTGGGPDGKSPILVSKGVSVLYTSYCMHRRVDMYGMDSETFRPERWDEEPLQSRNGAHRGWTFLPFGGGPRTCLGMDFSLTEGAYTIVRILQHFPSIKLPVGEQVQVPGKEKQRLTISLSPADGCRVDLNKELMDPVSCAAARQEQSNGLQPSSDEFLTSRR
ncbi:cytochrome P450 monooxygenase [Hypoxylon sp. NC1633]|nr:cytochrome P450 monooxygenase [Hypoxylon sp. NC1633]